MPRSTQHASFASLMIFKKTFLMKRLEKQHGKFLVSHAFGYITASGDGLSEPELGNLISLDDQVLQDIYQYWLPPIRQIPPFLWWTRIRTDISDFFEIETAMAVWLSLKRYLGATAHQEVAIPTEEAKYLHSMLECRFCASGTTCVGSWINHVVCCVKSSCAEEKSAGILNFWFLCY